MTQRSYWFFILVAAAILMITMGARQSLGLFVYPLNVHTGLGIATISFAMAVAQLLDACHVDDGRARTHHRTHGLVVARPTTIQNCSFRYTNILEATIKNRRTRSQLLVLTSRIFHLRILHRLSSNAHSQRSKFVWLKRKCCIDFISHY